jgi:type I restriction enzyme, S subunit
MPSPVPQPDEQRTIVRFLDHADRRIRRYTRMTQKLLKLLDERRLVVTDNATNSAGNAGRVLRMGEAVDAVQRLVIREATRIYTPLGLYNRGRGVFEKAPTPGADLGDSTFFWIAEGDLVLSGQFAWEGAVALVDQRHSGCICSHRYPVLRGRPGIAESAFVFSFLRTSLGQALLDYHSRGAAGRNRPLNITSLLKERIPIPSAMEQQEIAELVKHEARVREAVAGLARLLVGYRTRLFSDVVTGKLDVRMSVAELQDENESLDETEAEIELDEGQSEDDALESVEA